MESQIPNVDDNRCGRKGKLKNQLSHVCWLLSEAYDDIAILKDGSDSPYSINNTELCTIYQTFSNKIHKFGLPKESWVWDNYYNGWWLECEWGEYKEWIWFRDYDKKDIIKTILNEWYWWDVINGAPRIKEYIWDPYYSGWWLYSEWDDYNSDAEWIWVGTI